jgi:uncharacterized membrane protein YvbJ
MVYCSSCGEKISDDALFCPNCGTKTLKGMEKTVVSSEEIRKTFNKIEKEFEKALATAAEEIQAAFKKARDNVQKSTTQQAVNCPNCGQKNSENAVYCFNCGQNLEAETNKGK